MATTTKTPVMVLCELATKKKWPPPEFQIISQSTGTHVNRFDFAVNIQAAGIVGKGSGSSKQIGKQEAAQSALKQLQEMGLYDPNENPFMTFDVPCCHAEENNVFKAGLNCISDLQNLCIENKIPPPKFHEISSVGPPHAKEFAWECTVASIRTEAKANTKKMAKQLAAKEMLERIKDVLPEIAAQAEEMSRTLTNKDSEAIKKYNSDFVRSVVPDKSARVDEMPQMFVKLMNEKELTFADFSELFLQEVTEEILTSILGKLDLSYEITVIQEIPPIITIELNTERPFCAASLGSSIKDAKQKALDQVFLILESFLRRVEPKTSVELKTEKMEAEV